jgi:hypothetical protein
MNILLVAAKRKNLTGKILAKFSSVPSGTQHRRRFSIMRLVREGNPAQFLSKFFTLESQAL